MIENDNMRRTTEEELYRRFQSGDETAFEELVRLFRGSLARYINTFVNDYREAEDLMIDAFAELAINAKYKEQSSLKTYLFSIGRNITLKHIRKYKSSGYLPIDKVREETEYLSNLPEMTFVAEEQKAQLHTAMRLLKQDYYEVLYLIYFENMSYNDAGRTMKKTAVQVDHLLRRAKSSLKSILEAEEYEKRQGNCARSPASG